jgi:hypothetical protein
MDCIALLFLALRTDHERNNGANRFCRFASNGGAAFSIDFLGKKSDP